MKKLSIFLILFFFGFINSAKAQKDDLKTLYQKFAQSYGKGDLVNAEKYLLIILNSKNTFPEKIIIATYNNLGATNTLLGKYKEALIYYDKAEALIPDTLSLADIYINKAFIYSIQKSYKPAIEYYEKGIRIYKGLKGEEKKISQSLSSAYLNMGITYFETNDFKTALDNFNKSAELKLKYHLTGLGLVYVNLAKTSEKRGDLKGAEEYFLKSILTYKTEYGEDYFRMAEAYFDYGLFLNTAGRNKEALDVFRKALTISLRNYGDKHTFVSLAYKHIADYYLGQNNCDSALYYYQRSLISVVKYFNDPDIFANPSIDSAIFDIRLLDNLKSKAKALGLLAIQKTEPGLKIKTINKSIETADLALQLIDRIRNNYQSEESRIWLAENEKETYVSAIDLCRTLYNLTNKSAAVLKMYNIATKAKAAVLQREIVENDLAGSAGIPDSLRNKRDQLSDNIAAYNNLLLDELGKKDPDNKKITFWKDAIFDMNREKEKVTDRINKEYPQYHQLLQKAEPVIAAELQKHLDRDETVVDYLLSNQYREGKRKMYIFLVTKNNLAFHETELDSLFSINVNIIKKYKTPSGRNAESGYMFSDYTSSLFSMYESLIKPVEPLLSGKRIIIIPDEEISQLPFDAFIRSKPAKDQTDFEGLQYLINDYTFSFGYSSSLIFGKEQHGKKVNKVYAFEPVYSASRLSSNGYENLSGAGNEIGAIFKLFNGEKFTGEKASETNFREAILHPAIFHLAMHALEDSSDSRYSYLMFDPHKDTLNDGKLYNYEISLSRIKSPMVVVSACNSGTGTLYHGEGLMSLARGFILAGASSVVRTSWEVNDETSAAIITRFYFHLSEGKSKDEALRLSKLEYLKSGSPVYKDPYYWAAYEVSGDNSPVAGKSGILQTLLITLIMIGATVFAAAYFRRRRISADRSE